MNDNVLEHVRKCITSSKSTIQSTNKTEIYSRYDSLFHGRSFQMIDNIQSCDTNGIITTISINNDIDMY